MNFQSEVKYKLIFTLINTFSLNTIRAFCVKNLKCLIVVARKYTKDQWLTLGMRATESGHKMSS